MKQLITLGIFSLTFAAYGRAPSTYTQVKNDLQKISQKEVIRVVNQFVASSKPSRMVGMPGHEKAKDYILSTIKAFDPKGTGKVTSDTFTVDADEAKRFYQKDFDQEIEGKIPKHHPDYQKWLRFTSYMQQTVERLKAHQAVNIIWEKSGLNPEKTLVVMAHYDTISHDPNTFLITEKSPMPGANYNASGVSVALNLIKVLAQTDLNYSVQVVFLDWQGIGFLGSHRYAQELKKSSRNVMGFLNLEMLGQDTTYFDKSKKTGNMSVYFRPEDEKFIQTLISHGPKMTSKVSFIPKSQGFKNSDNIRMWENGFVGGTFSQNWEDDFNPKFYQTPQDTPETLNHETLYHGYLYIGGAVLGTLLDITK